MKGTEKKSTMDMKERISLLWIAIMFTMAFADILGFTLPGVLQGILQGTAGINITQELLLAMAVLVEIPILMIYLTKTLNWKTNRIANIIASIITIIFIIAGGSLYLHYIFFAVIEIIGLILIIVYAVKWKQEKGETNYGV